MKTKFTYSPDMTQDEIDFIERLAQRFISFSEIDKNAVMNDVQNMLGKAYEKGKKDERLKHLGWRTDDLENYAKEQNRK